MEIRLLIRDREFLKVLVDKFSAYQGNLVIEIIDSVTLSSFDNNSILLTDMQPSQLDQSFSGKYSAQTIFIVNKNHNYSDANTCIFKYQSIYKYISFISEFYFALTGDSVQLSGISSITCVCGDSKVCDYSHVSKSIASQIKYRLGGDCLLFTMQSINYFGLYDLASDNALSKIFYKLQSAGAFSKEEFFRKDEYGVYYIALPIGINELANIDVRSFYQLFDVFKKMFNHIVIDIGNQFSSLNGLLLNNASTVWWVSDTYTEKLIRETILESESKVINVLDIHKDELDSQIDELFSIQEQMAINDKRVNTTTLETN